MNQPHHSSIAIPMHRSLQSQCHHISNQTPIAFESPKAPPASGIDQILPKLPYSSSPLVVNDVASPTIPTAQPAPPPSSSSSPNTAPSLNASEDFDYSDLSKQRSLFSFEPKLLKPFMGLEKVDRKDDPWHYKPYNLYQPIYTGGATFESLLNRYRRQVSSDYPNSSQPKHVLTPGMLDRLLRIKVNFEKNYPFLYRTMMGHLLGDKYTALSITPPEIPAHVSYPNVELAAAEYHQLANQLLYQQHSQHYQQHYQQHPQQYYQQYPQQHPQQHPQQFIFDSPFINPDKMEHLTNPNRDETTFWNNLEDSQSESKIYWKKYDESEDESEEVTSPIQKRESFWSQLEAAEESETQRQPKPNQRLPLGDDLDSLFKADDDFN